MLTKTLRELITPILAALGINAIPIGGVLVGGWSPETAMVLYFLENCVAVLLAAARVRLLVPPGNDPSVNRVRNRSTVVKEYLIVALGLSAGSGVFLAAFLFLILRVSIPLSIIGYSMLGILIFQIVAFVADLVLLRPLTLARAETLLQGSLGRVALLHLAVFVGIFLAAIVNQWFLVPFIVLKAIVDIATPIQFIINQNAARMVP